MTSWEEKTLREVADEYNMSLGYITNLVQDIKHGHPCPFPARKFEGRWLIDTGSDEFKAFAASYDQSNIVRARREGRLKKRGKCEQPTSAVTIRWRRP